MNLKNLKKYKNENLIIEPNSLLNEGKYTEINNINNLNEFSEKRKNIQYIEKSNSITNSNMNTNPSLVYNRSDSINNHNLIKNFKVTNVIFLLIKLVPFSKNLEIINKNKETKNKDLQNYIINSIENEDSLVKKNNTKEKSLSLISSPKNGVNFISINELKKNSKFTLKIIIITIKI